MFFPAWRARNGKTKPILFPEENLSAALEPRSFAERLYGKMMWVVAGVGVDFFQPTTPAHKGHPVPASSALMTPIPPPTSRSCAPQAASAEVLPA